MQEDAPVAGPPRRFGHRVPTYIRVLLVVLGVPAILFSAAFAHAVTEACVVPVGPNGGCANPIFMGLLAVLFFSVPWFAAVISLAISDRA